jgi:hypothetical protein
MRIPRATYRLQLTPAFGFQAEKVIVPYLAELGISDLYVSPVFKARRGSLHGYDIVDPTRLNPELGTESDFEALWKELKAHDMGWLQDVVPNHMAFDPENEMLMDVLENGDCSEFFRFFDVNWSHPYPSIRGRLLAPLLGRFYGDALEQGEIRIQYGADGFTIHYYDLAFPLKVESYVHLLTHRLAALKGELGGDDPDLVKLLGILYVLRTLPSGAEIRERHDQLKFIKKTLWELYTNNLRIQRFIDENIRTFNGVSGRPETFALLDNLLSEQLFRLSFWKVATEEINYRRFFNINQLLSVRVEDENVFRRTHSLIFDLIDRGYFTGLRMDHIDGLYDPKRYLARLRGRYPDLYLVVEKILELREELRPDWPVQGTTGYDFLNHVNGLFCRKDHARRFARLYSGFIGSKPSYEDMVSDKKRLIMGKHMAGDIDNLAHLLKEVSSRDRFGSDITLYGLKRALVEVMAHFPVYRTYISKEETTENDASSIKLAVDKAVQSNPGLLNELRFIERFLLHEIRCCPTDEERGRWIDFVMRFQQFTGPLMAKGFEDTAFYVYNRLLSLNEVGGSPDIFGIDLKYLGIFYMAVIFILALLQWNLPCLLLLSFGTGGELFLIGYQIRSAIFCPYCLAFAATVLLSFFLNFERSRKWLVALAAGAGLLFFLLFFSGRATPAYAADSLMTTYGKGKIDVRIYTDYFCGPCSAEEAEVMTLITDLVDKNLIRVSFIDTPIHKETVLYAGVFLSALNARAGWDIRQVVQLRAALFDAAREKIKEKDPLAAFMKKRGFSLKAFDTAPVFKLFGDYLKEDRINATPTCVIVGPQGKQTLVGRDDTVKALVGLKK